MNIHAADALDRAAGLLEQQLALFLQYEQQTFQITAGAPEQIPSCMEERLRLQREIDWISQELRALCQDLPEGEQILNAVFRSRSCQELPPEYRGLFSQSMGIRAAIQRIQELEPQALERMESTRDSLLEQIKSINQGNEAVVSRYYRSTSPKAGEQKRTFLKL